MTSEIGIELNWDENGPELIHSPPTPNEQPQHAPVRRRWKVATALFVLTAVVVSVGAYVALRGPSTSRISTSASQALGTGSEGSSMTDQSNDEALPTYLRYGGTPSMQPSEEVIGIQTTVFGIASTPSYEEVVFTGEAASASVPSVQPSGEVISTQPPVTMSAASTTVYYPVFEDDLNADIVFQVIIEPATLSAQPSNALTVELTDAPFEKPTYAPTVELTNSPTEKPSNDPTVELTNAPTEKPTNTLTVELTYTVDLTYAPTEKPTNTLTVEPTYAPTEKPTNNPTVELTDASTDTYKCFTFNLYNAIDADIASLKNTLSDGIVRSHFLGGILRLAAHDFMDYDRTNSTFPYGADGCFDFDHMSNSGLPQDAWCETCSLRVLYESKYREISRADFWIASANAVIRQSSLNNTLDLQNTFVWGRTDRDSCPGAGARIPAPTDCRQVEDTFLIRMGLTWQDAVALLGAHSIGRGQAEFSGHEGVWVDGSMTAQVFDKKYYEELFNNAWHPRNPGTDRQDWTLDYTGTINPRMMLNTDLCLVYDIESVDNNCCTRQNECITEMALSACPIYSSSHSRREAADAVVKYLGGSMMSTDNGPFYEAFTLAWAKATTLGYNSLYSLSDNCDLFGS